jgi:hypothetical protein
MASRSPFAHEAVLRLAEGTDPGAPGAAVPCRWPHNNELSLGDDATATFRTIFVAPPDEADEAHTRIERALRVGAGWTVTSSRLRPLRPQERKLAANLATTPLP